MSASIVTGGCQCGAVRYQAAGDPLHHAVCHCLDCRKSAGAPMVAWLAFAVADFQVTQGSATEFASSEHGRRYFCASCGTGLYYINDEMLPGIIDIQSSTCDNAADLAPQAQIQMAERLGWVENLHELHGFERYPSGV